jgi:hypothetical protein
MLVIPVTIGAILAIAINIKIATALVGPSSLPRSTSPPSNQSAQDGL